MTIDQQLAEQKLELDREAQQLDERKAASQRAADRRRDNTRLDVELMNARKQPPKGDK